MGRHRLKLAQGERLLDRMLAEGIPLETEPGSRLASQARAAKFLAAQLTRYPAASGLRLSVEPTGCSGFGYRIDPAESARDGDTVFECRGIRIAVDPLSLPYLQGTTVDIVEEGLGRRLRFDNPNARESCGCGASFGT